MSFTIYDASAPIFVNGLASMRAWLDMALAQGKAEDVLMQARLAPDMRPLPSQYQLASDAAKAAVARLTGVPAPAMPDTETSFADLKGRCQRTIDFVQSVDRAAFDGAEDRPVIQKFPSGAGFTFTGRTYLIGFALPNFQFHVTTAYALLRASGVDLGKRNFLTHLGDPDIRPAA
jgi:hypothetical protein